jgi:hypothetical protein
MKPPSCSLSIFSDRLPVVTPLSYGIHRMTVPPNPSRSGSKPRSSRGANVEGAQSAALANPSPHDASGGSARDAREDQLSAAELTELGRGLYPMLAKLNGHVTAKVGWDPTMGEAARWACRSASGRAAEVLAQIGKRRAVLRTICRPAERRVVARVTPVNHRSRNVACSINVVRGTYRR